MFSHREDVRVRACLKERQSASHYEIGEKEGVIVSGPFCWDKEQSSGGIKAETHDEAGFIAESPDEQGGRQCHREIAAIECELH